MAKSLKHSVKKFYEVVSKVAGCRCATWLKMNCSHGIFQWFYQSCKLILSIFWDMGAAIFNEHLLMNIFERFFFFIFFLKTFYPNHTIQCSISIPTKCFPMFSGGKKWNIGWKRGNQKWGKKLNIKQVGDNLSVNGLNIL